jgi:hypothetical protein
MELWHAGAQFDWADFSPLSCLVSLTSLQLSQCLGRLSLEWLSCMTSLRRLYLRGNAPAPSHQLLALSGAGLFEMTTLQEVYLGLVFFGDSYGVALSA